MDKLFIVVEKISLPLGNVPLWRIFDYTWMRIDRPMANHGYTNLRRGWGGAGKCHIESIEWGVVTSRRSIFLPISTLRKNLGLNGENLQDNNRPTQVVNGRNVYHYQPGVLPSTAGSNPDFVWVAWGPWGSCSEPVNASDSSNQEVTRARNRTELLMVSTFRNELFFVTSPSTFLQLTWLMYYHGCQLAF